MTTDSNVEWCEPEKVELRLDEDGIKRWYLSTREGWQRVGRQEGRELLLNTAFYKLGTRFMLVEPREDQEEVTHV